MKKLKKLKKKDAIICAIISAIAVIAAAFITRGKPEDINTIEEIQRLTCVFNEDYVLDILETANNAAIIGKEKSTININNGDGTVISGDNNSTTINNGDNNFTTIIQEIHQSDEATKQEDDRERPYTVRETYACEQSGEPGKEYNFVCADTRLEGWCYVTYYTYDVTYY